MGKMKDALVKLAKKVTGKEVEDKSSISNIIEFMADNYEGGSTSKTTGQDLKDYLLSLDDPVVNLHEGFLAFLESKNIPVEEPIVDEDYVEGLSNSFTIRFNPNNDLYVSILGWDTGMTHFNTLKEFLIYGNDNDGMWGSNLDRIDWEDLDKPLSLSIRLGGVDYTIKNITLDEIKTFIVNDSEPKQPVVDPGLA